MDPKVLRLAGVGGAVILAGAGIYLLTKGKPEPKKEAAPQVAREAPIYRPRPQPMVAAPTSDLKVGLRPFDHEILALVPKSFPEEAMVKKDALPKSLASVTLVKERPGANIRIATVKVDLDRNGRDEEFWSFKDNGMVERSNTIQVGSTRYHDTYQLDGQEWHLTEGYGATLMMAPNSVPVVAVDLRPFDRQILQIIKEPMTSSHEADVLPDAPAKVDLYRAGSSKQTNRVIIDVNRDHKEDEVWFVAGRINRRVAPNNDGNFTESYQLKDDKWVRTY